MSTHTTEKGTTTSARPSSNTTKKAKFTVDQAARAFRTARGDTPKVPLADDEAATLRRGKSGLFVLVKTGAAGAKAGGMKRAAAKRTVAKRAAAKKATAKRAARRGGATKKR